MKKSLYKMTAPALAIGLAFSAQGGALAASPNAQANVNAEVKAEVKAEQRGFLNGGASLSHRLIPIEKRISSVDVEVAELTAELEATGSLSFEEYVYYQEQLNALFGQVGASTNQLQAVTKKFGEDSAEVAEAKAEINAAFSVTLEAQNLLDSIDVIEELPEVEEPADEIVSL